MASKQVYKAKNKLLATVVTGERKPCAFCQRDVDDEATYGKLYAIGDLQVHYFCALLSCCLVQRGRDSEGLFGFLYQDIVAEVERSKKHKCSYCNKGGASIGCSVSQCRKQYHLPCGREKNAVSLFYGNYKSFCQQHAPRQKIPDHIMAEARLRMKKAKNALKAQRGSASLKDSSPETSGNECSGAESVCVICYEPVSGFPCARSFWPPCCARDAWFHRDCVQRMALSAGVHYLKCPLCNDKEQFRAAAVGQGFYVPDRDASWELEQGAFADIYERPSACSAGACLCPAGRRHDAGEGLWDIQLCMLCGALGCHAGCAPARFVCAVCRACAPADLDALADTLDKVMQAEQRQSRVAARRRVMPSRMSLRRTKARSVEPSTSQMNNAPANYLQVDDKNCQSKSDTTTARLDLNLRTPRRAQPTKLPKQTITNTETTVTPQRQNSSVLKAIENTLFSPTKLVEEGLTKKFECLGVNDFNSNQVITKVKEKLKKPRPLSVKRKIVNTFLDQILLDILKQTHKPKEWNSPRKTNEITKETSQTDITEAKEDDVDPTEEEDKRCNETDKEDLKDDESSNSTFQLPSEFIADQNSDDSLLLFETPKKLTTVDIQKDSSLEISENNEKVNINVVKIEENGDNDSKDFIMSLKLKFPVKNEKCAFKFNPTDKEALVENNLHMNMESFKNFYLNEVDRMDKDFQCAFKHQHGDEVCKDKKLCSAIDFAVEATKTKDQKRKNLKRKLQTKNGVVKKKSKMDEEIVFRYNKDNSSNNKAMCSNESEDVTEMIDLTVDSPKTKKSLKMMKSKKRNENMTDTIDLTVQTVSTKRLKKVKKNKKLRRNIQVKIKFREERLRLEITKSQIKNKKQKNHEHSKKKQKNHEYSKKKQKNHEYSKKKQKNHDHSKKLKQCILQYAEKSSPNKVIVKPEYDVTPKKRNYVKLEKSPDSLVQTSIQSFFKKISACQSNI